MQESALLIIDMQPDFMSGGPLPVAGATKLIPIINQLQAQFEVVIATQDWHPKNHESFKNTWPEHCIQGTPGAALHPDIETKRISSIIRKGMNPRIDSYSAFYDNEHQASTGLAGYLQEKGIKTLYFTGLCADVCVYYSIIDALDAGFTCVLITDATCALSETDYQEKLNTLLKKGVRCIQSHEI